jgi:hypothetical protein
MYLFFTSFLLHSRSSHFYWFNTQINVRRRLFYRWWSLSLCDFLHAFLCYKSVRSKYSPQNFVLRHSQSVFFPYSERSSFTPIRNYLLHFYTTKATWMWKKVIIQFSQIQFLYCSVCQQQFCMWSLLPHLFYKGTTFCYSDTLTVMTKDNASYIVVQYLQLISNVFC